MVGVHPEASAGTRAMAERLARLADADPFSSEYRNDERLAIWEQRIEEAGGAEAAPPLTILSWARELMLAGRPREALEQFEAMGDQLTGRSNKKMLSELRHMTGLAWMRVAEQQNCLEHHTLDSCLLPLQGDGLHEDPEGGLAAMEVFRAALEDDPKDWAAVWLLNLAAMTVGRWPEEVPERWRLPPEVFASEAELTRFHDVAAGAGVNTVGLAGGVCMEDFDGDGLLDLMVSSWGLRDPLRLFRNTGDGRFEERTEQARLAGLTGGLNLVHADHDNDGDADVLVLRGAWVEKAGGYPNSLLRNEGGLVFDDVTEQLGLLSSHPTQAAAWGDYDDDGWLDLYVGNETGPAETHPCELFHNDGAAFSEVAGRMGVALEGYIKGVAWGDIDNDGDLDLYASRIDGPNWLLRNDGPKRAGKRPKRAGAGGAASAGGAGDPDDAAPSRGDPAPVQGWRFTDISVPAGVQEPVRSFPTWFFDADNDGWLDLFVAGYRWGSTGLVARDYLGQRNKGVRAKLFHNNGGDGTFTDVSEEKGVHRVLPTMGSNFGDIDNDGWHDFYCGTGEPDFGAVYPNRMFLGDGAGGFLDVTTAGGFGHVQKGHGIAFGDLDNDGDQDVYAVMGGAYTGDVFPNALFLNPGTERRWLGLELEGVEANRSAIGARIRVRVAEPGPAEPGRSRGPLVERDIHRVVGTGGSFGASSLRQEIGLGEAHEVVELEVVWPGSGRVQRFGEVPLDRIVRLREGGGLEVQERPGIPLGD